MIRKLLVALDGSVRADGVFRSAAQLAESVGASLHLLRVIAVPPEFPPAGHVGHADELPAYLLTQAVAHLRTFAARAPHLRIEVIVRESLQPWRAIIDAAEAVDADLVVVGSHGYRGLDHLLGTNAGKVANQASRNVLVVHRPPDPPQAGGYRHAPRAPGAG
jgi:nucleotide-binding universal stress UspA family protein